VVQRYWSIWSAIIVTCVYMTGCPPVAALDPTPVGDDDVGKSTITASSCVLKESPYVYPATVNYCYTGKPIVKNRFAWGIHCGMSGVSPFVKWQVFHGPIQLYIRAGAGGFPYPVPVHLFGVIGHYHGDATFNIKFTDMSGLYLGAKSFAVVAYMPHSDTIAVDDTLDLLDEDEFVQGVWLGGFLGFRAKNIGIELGIHRILDGTDGLKNCSFDDWSPSMGFSYYLKSNQ
jgi:hypothetical protein